MQLKLIHSFILLLLLSNVHAEDKSTESLLKGFYGQIGTGYESNTVKSTDMLTVSPDGSTHNYQTTQNTTIVTRR